MVNAENTPQSARSITLSNVKRCIGEGDPLVAICCDSGRSFRKDISPDYKANREKQPEAAYGELQKTKDRLRSDGYLLWEASGFEADDIIATACDKAVSAGHEVRVCSADKDMLSLIGPCVDVLRTATWTVWGEKEFTERFKIKPALFTDWLALKGDTSDNIPGCDGCGDKTATELLLKFGTVAKLYEALEAKAAFLTPKLTENLIACQERVELSRKLVELRFDVPIEFAQIYEKRKPQPLTGDLGDMDEPAEEFSESPKAESAPIAMEPAPGASEEKSAPSAAVPVTTALVPVEYERQLEPTSIGTAYKLAKGLVTSRLYSRFPNEEAIMAVIIRGRELGLGALASLDSFHIIEGRPCPHAYLMIARAKADPDCEYFQCIETDEESAMWETKNRRNPKPTRLRYTLEMAKASGLYQPAQEKTNRDGKKYMSKDNQWVVRPGEMIRKTAGVQLARMEYPAATLGLYAWEEMGGE